LKYRPEIDGLRALAVISVLIYHARFTLEEQSLLSGGFLGVDIFFVISGYLITSIIGREISRGKFSFSHFYTRRALRILPALFVVILASIPFASILMLPKAFKEYAASILASLTFGSNILFWQEDSYTAEPSALKPFLHTWSLSVEEQFYIFFPILLMALWRLGKRGILNTLIVIFFASLLGSQFGSYYFSNANFFLIPTRAWELIAGALLALWEQENKNNIRAKFETDRVVSIMPKLGLLAIIASLFCFDESTPHPSLLTAIPVFGVVAIVRYSTPTDVVFRLLSSKPMVWIGLISYSLYLWHFPIFAFLRLQEISLGHIGRIAVLLSSVVFAYLSYRYVEQPFRHRLRKNTRSALGVLCAAWILILIAQLYIYKNDGLPARLGLVSELFSAAEPNNIVNGDYKIGSNRPTLISVGDSHAEMLSVAIRSHAHQSGYNFSQYIRPACPLIKNVNRFDDGKLGSPCNPEIVQHWHSHIQNYQHPIIILSMRMSLYVTGERYDNGEGGVEPGGKILITTDSQPSMNIEGVAKQLRSTIAELLDKNIQVVLIYPIPEMGWHIPKKMKKALSSVPTALKLDQYRKMELHIKQEKFLKRSKSARSIYDSIPNHPQLLRIYPEELFCSEVNEVCLAHDDFGLFYSDDNHLSPYAANLLVTKIINQLKKSGWVTPIQ